MQPFSHSKRTERFALHLPIVSLFVRNPWVITLVLVIVACVASFFSIHYGLSALIFSLPFFSYYLERNLLERVLIPPYSCFVIWESLGSGSRIAIIIFGRGGELDKYLMLVQIVTLLCVPLWMGVLSDWFWKASQNDFP